MEDASRYYDEYWSREAPPDSDPLTAPRLDLFKEAVPRGASVLDVGCGRGRCASALVDAGYRVTGIDISERAVAEARSAVQAADFRVHDLSTPLPFPSKSFDSAFMTDVIEHLFDTRTIVAEIFRVLKPRGQALISTPYHGVTKNALIAIFRFDRHFDPQGPHIRFFSRRTLTDLLRDAGFRSFAYFHLGRVFPVWKNLVVIARKG